MNEDDVQIAVFEEVDRVYCDNCKTSIVNFHRSCPNPSCSYDICLDCCSELRRGLQLGGNEAKWEAKNDMSIPCPPKELGGCGTEDLALRRILNPNWVETLIMNAEDFTSDYQLPDIDFSQKCSLCSISSTQDGIDLSEVRQAAFREYGEDNFLYCPNAIDLGDAAFEHFQMHWRKGEPVIVRNALAKASGLSWEPMVMLRAFRKGEPVIVKKLAVYAASAAINEARNLMSKIRSANTEGQHSQQAVLESLFSRVLCVLSARKQSYPI